MNDDRKQAVVLREAGSSYSEIKAKLGIPRSTLSKWFKDQKWSNDIAIKNASKARNSAAIKLMVLNTVRGVRLKKIYTDSSQDAYADFEELKYHPLFMAGVMLYACHGNRTSKHRTVLSSSDPAVVKTFTLFLKRVCNVHNIQVQLLLKQDFNREESIKAFWMEKCGLKSTDFLKTGKIKAKKPSNKPYFGICNLIINGAYLKNKILKWQSLIFDDLGAEKYFVSDQLPVTSN